MATAIYSIDKVFWKEEIYDSFTPEELKEKIKLTRPTCMKIVKALNNLVKMKLVVELKCHNKECEYKEDYVIRDFLKYLT